MRLWNKFRTFAGAICRKSSWAAVVSPGYLDRQWYLETYPDVAASGLSPLRHYVLHGATEGRHPNRRVAEKANEDQWQNSHFSHSQSLREQAARYWHYRQFESEYENKQNFSGLETDIKAIAFFLPQFHRCPQNDEWWGEGFTEWTNTESSRPRFPYHYQPREPHDDIGYYDLSNAETLRMQAKMAREHGIFGFCFYHYWFSGKRVLEKPLDLLVENKDIDINFCIAWANENWTRTWDGLASDILLEQKYLKEDALAFIKDAEKYLVDPRYIKINNKPVILVYKSQEIPNVRETFAQWRKYWKDQHGADLHILCMQLDLYDRYYGNLSARVDGLVGFPPMVIPPDTSLSYKIPMAEVGDVQGDGHFFNYWCLVDDVVNDRFGVNKSDCELYQGVTLGWDNSARRKNGWSVWYGYSREEYDKWLRYVIADARKRLPSERRFVFINAWNEWAEGTYLEPDRRTGYTALNTTARAIFDLPSRDEPVIVPSNKQVFSSTQLKVAVHVHIYHIDLLDEIVRYVDNIPFPFDLFLTTNTDYKKEAIEKAFSDFPQCGKVKITVTSNRGRDIGPFFQIGGELLEYDIIGHFHTKKSATVNWGDLWRRYLFDNLLGSPDAIAWFMAEFKSDPTLGMVFPPAYPLLPNKAGWSSMREESEALFRRLGFHSLLPKEPTFPAGNMFWARKEAIKKVLEENWTGNDFQDEKDQLEHTTGHYIERIWKYIAVESGYEVKETLVAPFPERQRVDNIRNRLRISIFVHYDQHGNVCQSDIEYIQQLKEHSDKTIVVTNSEISEQDKQRLLKYSHRVIHRDNIGYDFAGWRDAINLVGMDSIRDNKELILCNNSVCPVYSLREMFSRMDRKECDFWGITDFPEIRHSNRPEAASLVDNTIPAHIQSYFMVFRENILKSDTFFRFWQSVENKSHLQDVVSAYEIRLTQLLKDAGFNYSVYIPEAGIMQKMRAYEPHFNATYAEPYKLWLLRTPLIKKKGIEHNPEQMRRALQLADAPWIQESN